MKRWLALLLAVLTVTGGTAAVAAPPKSAHNDPWVHAVDDGGYVCAYALGGIVQVGDGAPEGGDFSYHGPEHEAWLHIVPPGTQSWPTPCGGVHAALGAAGHLHPDGTVKAGTYRLMYNVDNCQAACDDGDTAAVDALTDGLALSTFHRPDEWALMPDPRLRRHRR